MDANRVGSAVETRAEAIVRTLHGRVPRWASGAIVEKIDALNYTEAEKVWFQDATFDAIGHTGHGACFYEHDAVRFEVWRRATPRTARRYNAPVFPRMMEVCFTGEDVKQELGTEEFHTMCALIKGQYHIVAAKMREDGPAVRLPIREHHTLGVTLNGRWFAMNPESLWATMTLRQRYEWTVAMSVDGGPSLRFACTPASARDAFRLRDLPSGKNRRDALIHWVAQHYRNPDIHVSEHLRGKHVFSWRGIACEIVPSAFDREKEIARKARPRQRRPRRYADHRSRVA